MNIECCIQSRPSTSVARAARHNRLTLRDALVCVSRYQHSYVQRLDFIIDAWLAMRWVHAGNADDRESQSTSPHLPHYVGPPYQFTAG